ncbi:MAG TPA: PepSY domain-containing protein [Xanthobacteraceae bacterium]|nr:PepSY domain-containing protein [Xanthobacteraceae bacterium]
MIASFALLLSTASVFADPAPPADAMALSSIIAKLEQRADFAHIKEIDWDDGLYEVEYRTKDGGSREVKLDPRTGETRGK